jgi:hypothetical protein
MTSDTTVNCSPTAAMSAYTLGSLGLIDSDAASAYACPVTRPANMHPAAKAIVRMMRRLEICREGLILYDAG